MLIPLLLIPFLIVYFSCNEKAKKIAFGIVLTFLAYCTWTVILTIYLTNALYDNHIIKECSLWDIFALLIPFALTIWTLIWSMKKRKKQSKFEIWYLCSIIILLLIITNRPSKKHLAIHKMVNTIICAVPTQPWRMCAESDLQSDY